jgi:hypothetical protein
MEKFEAAIPNEACVLSEFIMSDGSSDYAFLAADKLFLKIEMIKAAIPTEA